MVDTQMDNNDAICPYCKSRYQVEGADYDEARRVQECDICGKKYWTYQSFSVETHTQPDCKLNGIDHRYEKVMLKNGCAADFCIVCEMIRV